MAGHVSSTDRMDQYFLTRSWGISLSLLTRRTAVVQFSAGAAIFFSLCNWVHTGYRTHPALSPVGARIFSPGVKWSGHGANHSPPSNAETYTWRYTSTPPYVLMAWCLIKHGIYLMACQLIKHRLTWKGFRSQFCGLRTPHPH